MAYQFCSNVMLAEPILAAQVLIWRKIIKNGSAVGPDGISKACLVRWDPTGEKLAERIPKVLKRN